MQCPVSYMQIWWQAEGIMEKSSTFAGSHFLSITKDLAIFQL